MLTEKLMNLVVAGGSEWVMVLLIVLSVISVGVMIERGLFFRSRRQRLDRLDRDLTPLISASDPASQQKLQQRVRREGDPTLQAAAGGLDQEHPDREATEKHVAGALGRERLLLERRLIFLGTLGNNAPFIGLFGTVLGIIRAFRDLAVAGRPDTTVVMAGISEALVATAIGLFVALPAVLFYNYFMRQVDYTLSVTESLAQGILARMPGQSPGDTARAAEAAGVKE
jgi:biopolymer transport protein ExbB